MTRPVPFVAWQPYRALQSFGSFVAGRRYEYRWSRYQYRDGETLLTFYDPESGRELDWFWFDNEPDSLCVERFEIPDRPPAASP